MISSLRHGKVRHHCPSHHEGAYHLQNLSKIFRSRPSYFLNKLKLVCKSNLKTHEWSLPTAAAKPGHEHRDLVGTISAGNVSSWRRVHEASTTFPRSTRQKIFRHQVCLYRARIYKWDPNSPLHEQWQGLYRAAFRPVRFNHIFKLEQGRFSWRDIRLWRKSEITAAR